MDPSVPESKSDFYRTPRLERFAQQGMLFSDAYAAAPNCSPSRLSLLTGKSPAQLQMTDNIDVSDAAPVHERLDLPSSIQDIPDQERTIAEILKDADPPYATAHFGKWHLGGGGPGRHGFERHDGATRNSEGQETGAYNPKNMLGITWRASAFLELQAQTGQAFYLQLSHYALHTDMAALGDTIKQYRARPRGERHDHPVHAAMTENLDQVFGQILDKLDDLGLAEHTFVIYMSDNGAYILNTNNWPLAGGKAMVREGGVRVPLLIRGPGIGQGVVSHIPVIGWDLLPTLLDLSGVGAPLPEGVEGGSLRALLEGRGAGSVVRPRELLAWHFPHYKPGKAAPQSAVRLGDYKLIEDYDTREVQLFDLREDIGEARDLSAVMPERAEAMRRRLREYLEEVGAPMPRLAKPLLPPG
jgi:arylsulfatase A-like enzyme